MPVNEEKTAVVPVEPTEAMLEACFEAHAKAETVLASAADVWSAMLSAAPPQPASRGEGEAVAIYVPMPLNASGRGPAHPDETFRVEHQIWDAETNGTLCTAKDESVARWIVSALNASPPPAVSPEDVARLQKSLDRAKLLMDNDPEWEPRRAHYQTLILAIRDHLALFPLDDQGVKG